MKAEDVLFESCYDFHLSLVSKREVHSTNEYLQLTISTLHDQVKHCEDVLVSATTAVMLQVAEALLCNHALLMSTVYEQFLKTTQLYGVKSAAFGKLKL